MADERRAHFKHGALSSADAQARRRRAALEAQKERRNHAFMQARSLTDLDAVSELSFEADSEEDDEVFHDAAETTAAERDQRTQHGKGKSKRKKVRPWSRNLLSFAETLDLSDGLPDLLESEWSALVVPKGKRCLCVSSGSSSATSNTLLLSRVSGRTLHRRKTCLPADTLLDCIFDSELNILWVLDLVKYKSVWYVEHEHSFRAFFLAAKMSELPPQHYLGPPIADGQDLPVLVQPAPVVQAPLTLDKLVPLIEGMATRQTTLPATVLTSLWPAVSTQIEVPIVSTGLLLYITSAHYESGNTALVGWIPNQVEPGREANEGMARFVELVREWAARGGPAANTGSMET